MKINKIEERFDNEREKRSHFRSHVTKDGRSNDVQYPDKMTFTFNQFPNSRVYEEAADKLAKTPVGGDILGYVRRDGRYAKYKKSTKEFVVYKIENDEPIDITYFPCERSYWEKQKNKSGKEGYLCSIDPKTDMR